MTPLLLTLALAEEPVVNVASDGTINARITMDAEEAAVRAALANGAAAARLSPDILSSSATRVGSCEEVSSQVRGLFSPFALRTRRCPTTSGYREQLVSSDGLRSYDSTWEIREDGPGRTQVNVRMRTEVSLPVPTSLAQSHQARSLKDVLRALAAKVVGRKQRH